MLGPRIGKYNADKSANTIPGHHIPMAMLGCFILLFGWFGFNAASTFAATDIQFATVAANTAIAGALDQIRASAAGTLIANRYEVMAGYAREMRRVCKAEIAALKKKHRPTSGSINGFAWTGAIRAFRPGSLRRCVTRR